MNYYIKAGLVAIPIWWLTGTAMYYVGALFNIYRPAEAGLVWANWVALGSFIYFADKYRKQQKREDDKLFHRRRIYKLDMEETFREIQLVMTKDWGFGNRWSVVAADMPSGYIQFGIRWQNKTNELEAGLQALGQLCIYFRDASDDLAQKTEATLVFCTNANFLTNRIFFREMVKQVIARLDHEIPQHEKQKLSEEESSLFSTKYETTNGD